MQVYRYANFQRTGIQFLTKTTSVEGIQLSNSYPGNLQRQVWTNTKTLKDNKYETQTVAIISIGQLDTASLLRKRQSNLILSSLFQLNLKLIHIDLI